ncbi:hypothetical protein GPA22_13145 [Aromatoleum toluvorans]|uniref:Cytochrome c7-like domain-containing protein n=2 Tax=Aromatoleum toluvorans TaxID=92002 RepID=A0ABX1PZ58_9RHOO|nr:hypothetical protein [Aromatoleum toluvorans]
MSFRLRRTLLGRFLCCLCLLMMAAASADDRSWLPIAKDGLRDPNGPAAKVLQQPADALTPLAPDTAGNQVRWVRALREGQISPRSSLRKPLKSESYDKDVLLNLNGGMPVVRFPHSIHNEWLDCTNCHDQLFQKERGATKISMFLILQGEQCGVCHGAVAFPLTECARCHSVKRADALAELEREAAAKAAAQPPAPAAKPTPATAAPDARGPARKTEGKSK